MLDFIVSPPEVYGASGKYPVRTSIPDEASYAFFYRYFQSARLDYLDSNFLGFWGGTSVTGYQLTRLRQVLEDALLDLSARAPRFRVLRGWKAPEQTQGTENWAEVSRDDLVEITRELIDAIDLARSTTNHLRAIGD